MKGYENRFICNQDTSFVLEAYPRSGNTFSIDFIRHTNTEKKLTIAHHTHNHNNILLGIHFGIPTIVLIRDPLDAISSYMIYSGKNVETAAKNYYDFYSPLLKYKDSICYIKFEDIINNMNLVIEKINRTFCFDLNKSTNLVSDNEIVKNMDRDRAKKNRSESEYIRTVGAPTKEREIIKKQTTPLVAAYLNDNDKLRDLFKSLT